MVQVLLRHERLSAFEGAENIMASGPGPNTSSLNYISFLFRSGFKTAEPSGGSRKRLDPTDTRLHPTDLPRCPLRNASWPRGWWWSASALIRRTFRVTGELHGSSGSSLGRQETLRRPGQPTDAIFRTRETGRTTSKHGRPRADVCPSGPTSLLCCRLTAQPTE